MSSLVLVSAYLQWPICLYLLDVPNWRLPDFMLRSWDWYPAVNSLSSADVLNTGTTTAEGATPLTTPDRTDLSSEVHGRIHPATPVSPRQATNMQSERTIDASAAVP